ncbi:acyltransferase family protein [Kitasatospora sp. NPDC052868]|uniref:acyltransferase family protein n=1 Tax=Kitasatospora sp. NPDC052868 TaxID=3364060 RepID=UPI0037C93FDB
MTEKLALAGERTPATPDAPSAAVPAQHRRSGADSDGGSRPRTGGPAAPRAPRILVLDGLRLVAALAVLLFHYLAGSGEIPWQRTAVDLFPTLHRIAEFGWLGVVFFFMISGFVICMSSWGKSVQDFWRGRILRLFPVYWFAVVLGTVVARFGPHTPNEPRITVGQMLTNLTMLQEPLKTAPVDNVYWTLWVELRFYVIFTVVVALGTGYRRVANFCWIWALASVLAPISGIPLLDVLSAPLWAPFFIAGTAFYLVRRQGRFTGETLGLLALCWLLIQHNLPEVMAHEGHGINWKICLTAVTAMYGLMALVALGRLDRVQWRWLPVAGAISYPLYLVHQSVGVRYIWRWNETFGAWTTLLSVTAAMLLAAWLVHRLVERPATRLLRHLTRPSPTDPA